MAQLFFNNARGVLAESISTGSTLIKIKNHENVPTGLASGDYFLLTLFRDTTRYGENLEVVKVTAITAGTNGQLNLTVERGYEYPAQIHSAGARLEARLTAQSLRDLLDEAKSFTQAELNALLDSAPGALDTLNELAAALGDDPNFATTMTNALATKLDSSAYTAADVLAKLLTVDGTGTGLDADKLDGKELATLETEYKTYADQVETDAKTHADTVAGTAETNAKSYTDTQLAPVERKQLVDAIRKTATLDLDFSSGDYAKDDGEKLRTTNAQELLTVERASPKWVFGPNGLLREVPPNTLARSWNPETGEPEGVLIEESRANAFTFSSFQNGLADTSAKGGLLSAIAMGWLGELPKNGVAFGHDGSTDSFAYKNYTSASVGSTYTFSAFVEMDDGGAPIISSPARPDRDFSVILEGVGAISPSVEHVGGKVYKVSGHVVCEDSVVQGGIVKYSENSTRTFKVSGYQLEQGSTASSYIPTTDAPATRAADNVSRTLGGEFNVEKGTIVVDFTFTNGVLADSASSSVFEIGGLGGLSLFLSSTEGRILLRYGSPSDGLAPYAETFYDTGVSGLRLAVVYDDIEAKLYINGFFEITKSKIEEVQGPLSILGSYSTLNGFAKEVNYYPYAMTAAQLEELTAL